VNNQEMVSLVRQRDNRHEPNAVRVDNVYGDQVGHIERELAKRLATIMDFLLARVEGSVSLLSSLLSVTSGVWEIWLP